MTAFDVPTMVPRLGHRVLDVIAQSLLIALGLLPATEPMLIHALVLVANRPQ